jgi:hypothetical protein
VTREHAHASILRRCSPEEIVGAAAGSEPVNRVADLLNLDVEVVGSTTPLSLHFEIDQDDEGIGPDDLVHGSLAAGRPPTAG